MKNTKAYNFTVNPPYGVEKVKVVASLQPMKDMDIKSGESGFRSLGKTKDINEHKVLTRSLSRVPQVARAEHICTFTTSGETR